MEILCHATELQSTTTTNYIMPTVAKETDDIDYELGIIPNVMILRFAVESTTSEKNIDTNDSENAKDECYVETQPSAVCDMEEENKVAEDDEMENITVLSPKKKRTDNEIRFGKISKKVKKRKKQKERKWQKVPCSSIGINMTLFPRPSKTCEFEGDIDNLLSEIDTELNGFEKRANNFEKVLEYEMDKNARFNIRASKHNKIQKAVKQVKTKHCRNLTNNKSRVKLYINHRVLNRITLKEKRSYLHLSSEKPKKTAEIDTKPVRLKTKTNSNRGTWQDQNGNAPVQNLTHALDTSNNPGDFDVDVLSLLINLQHRELTPEDYEILSMLDQSVAPKTVSENQLSSFRTEQVQTAMLGVVCAVCMEPYCEGQTVKYLPCGHDFHCQCIDMWLSNSSRNCPLDGLSVDSS